MKRNENGQYTEKTNGKKGPSCQNVDIFDIGKLDNIFGFKPTGEVRADGSVTKKVSFQI